MARVRNAVLLALAAAVGTVYALAVLNATPPHPDLDVYLQGARNLTQGRSLYEPFLQAPGDPALRYAFIYPPLFAILIAPLLLLPAFLIPFVWLAATQSALAVTFWLVCRRLRAKRLVVLLALTITLAFYPLWADASQAQANLPILLFVILGILGVSNGNPRAGLWIGFAAALKLTPALLIGWLLWERRFRAAAWMSAGFLGVTLLAALARPMDTFVYARTVVPALAAGTAYYSNQSIAGLMARLFSPNPYTTPLVVVPWVPVLVAFVVIAAAAAWLLLTRRQLEPLGRGLTFLPLLPLAAAVSWEHHLVILLPLLWLILSVLAERGWPLRQTVVAGVAVLCLLAIPHLPFGPPFGTDFARAAHTRNPLLLAGANRLLLGTAILLLAGPWLVSTARQASAVRGVAHGWPAWRKAHQIGNPPSTSSSWELDQPA